MSTFNHNGIEITLLPSGKFTAETVEGKITAASLDAMKKRLDKIKSAGFKPFTAFVLPSYGKKELLERTVTGIVEGRGRYGRTQFTTAHGSHSYVYADTPENRAAAMAYIEMKARHQAIIDAMGQELQAALDAIVEIRAGESA